MSIQEIANQINFARRYQAYKPRESTLTDRRILELLKNDTHSFHAISEYLDVTCRSLREPGAMVLNIGSGSGGMVGYLSQKFPEARFVDLDIALKALRFIHDSSSPNPSRHLTCADVRAIPLPDNSIDVVVAHGVFRYIKGSPLSAIQEINSVLKIGGTAFISEGKDSATMGDCYSEAIYIQTNPRIVPLPFRMDNIRMPRLTLFYALFENYENDPDIAAELNRIRKENPDLNLEEALFRIAGESCDYIFGLQWTKSDDGSLSIDLFNQMAGINTNTSDASDHIGL